MYRYIGPLMAATFTYIYDKLYIRPSSSCERYWLSALYIYRPTTGRWSLMWQIPNDLTIPIPYPLGFFDLNFPGPFFCQLRNQYPFLSPRWHINIVGSSWDGHYQIYPRVSRWIQESLATYLNIISHNMHVSPRSYTSVFICLGWILF